MTTRLEYPEYLKKLLETHRITQLALADALGVDASVVSRWLSTTRKTRVLPSIRSIENIEQAITNILAKRTKARAVKV